MRLRQFRPITFFPFKRTQNNHNLVQSLFSIQKDTKQSQFRPITFLHSRGHKTIKTLGQQCLLRKQEPYVSCFISIHKQRYVVDISMPGKSVFIQESIVYNSVLYIPSLSWSIRSCWFTIVISCFS